MTHNGAQMRQPISRGTGKMKMKTVTEIHAELAAAKIVAMNNFERDWGTRDVRVVAEALRRTIPSSTSPTQATRKARHLVDFMTK